jgi:hypothetical protein
VSFKLRYQDLDFEGEQARRFAEQILKAVKPAYPEYVSADADAYDYGNQYEVTLVTDTGVRRKLRFMMRDKPSPILASIAFMQHFHNREPEPAKADEAAQVMAPNQPPKPKNKGGRPKKVARYVEV